MRRLNLPRDTRCRLEDVEIHDARSLFSTPVSVFGAGSGLSDIRVADLISAACVPPARSQVEWMSLGECLHRLINFDALAWFYSGIGALPLSRGEVRNLRRYGMTSIGRLMSTSPEVMLRQRGIGPRRLSRICEALLIGPSDIARSTSLDLEREPVSLGDWIQLRVRMPRREEMMRACAASGRAVEPGSDLERAFRLLLRDSEEALQAGGMNARQFATLLTHLSGTG